MKRLIQSKIETLVARKLIEGEVVPGSELVVDVAQNGFNISSTLGATQMLDPA
jgi:ATP-dependent Clp protease ATP-binding subunit ClpA